MVSKTLITLGVVGATGIGAGFWKGYSYGNGNFLPTGVDPLMSYGFPIIGAGASGLTSVIESHFKQGPQPVKGLADAVHFVGSTAAGGLTAIISELVGYGAGYLTSKIS
jgi:hypothetical protein